MNITHNHEFLQITVYVPVKFCRTSNFEHLTICCVQYLFKSNSPEQTLICSGELLFFDETNHNVINP